MTEYLGQVLPMVAQREVDRGGPVILVQVENEYGAYGSDADYLRALVRATRAAGITVPLTTVDQAADDTMLARGSLPELHRTASFGSRSTERLATLRTHQADGPLMCSEFWVGWFDHWGGPHHTTDAAQSAADLDDLLRAGASVNIYMLHGGTNFGFTNGANDDEDGYRPTVTSYDYDALLTESGEPTAKYWAFREVIARYAPVPRERPTTAPGLPRHRRPPGPATTAPAVGGPSRARCTRARHRRPSTSSGTPVAWRSTGPRPPSAGACSSRACATERPSWWTACRPGRPNGTRRWPWTSRPAPRSTCWSRTWAA